MGLELLLNSFGMIADSWEGVHGNVLSYNWINEFPVLMMPVVIE